jgi:hypothetical protein
LYLGYKPPTVYKVQRQLRKAGKGHAQLAQPKTPGKGGPRVLRSGRNCTPEPPAESAGEESELTSQYEESGELSALHNQIARLEANVDQLSSVLGDANISVGVSRCTQETFRAVLENRRALHLIARRLGIETRDLFRDE